jgi:hypothetical protein
MRPTLTRDVSRGSAALAASVATLLFSCATTPSRPTRDSPVLEARWQDAFDAPPRVLVALRPGALQTDPVYGPLLRRVLDLARQRSRVVTATRAIDAMEGAEEVLVGVDGVGSDDTAEGDLVAVVIGVRADVDPGELVDSDGNPQWSVGPSGRVRELIRDHDEQGEPLEASLFELPGRTWVIASGQARLRSRDAFARPRGRPDPVDLEPDALAVLRIDGPSLVARVPVLRPPSELAAIGHGMRSVTFELASRSAEPVRALLVYATPEAAAAAEQTVRVALDAVRSAKPAGLAWLGAATLDRAAGGTRVVLAAPLPPTLVAGLLRGGSISPIDSAPANP